MDVATIVITRLPNWAKAGAVSRSELLPADGLPILGGVKTALTPAGRPVTVNVRSPLKPPEVEVVIGIRTLEFLTKDAMGGAVTENPLTTIVTIAVCDCEGVPPVPVTTM